MTVRVCLIYIIFLGILVPGSTRAQFKRAKGIDGIALGSSKVQVETIFRMTFEPKEHSITTLNGVTKLIFLYIVFPRPCALEGDFI